MINIVVFFCALVLHELKSFENFFAVKFVKNLVFFASAKQTFFTFWNFMFRTEIAFHLLSFPRSVSFLSSTVAGEDTSSASRNQRSLHRFENLIFFIFFIWECVRHTLPAGCPRLTRSGPGPSRPPALSVPAAIWSR